MYDCFLKWRGKAYTGHALKLGNFYRVPSHQGWPPGPVCPGHFKEPFLHPCTMTSCPVEPVAGIAPGITRFRVCFRGIWRCPDFRRSGRSYPAVAQGAPVKDELRPDQSIPDEEQHLIDDLGGLDENGTRPSPLYKVPVPREDKTAILLRYPDDFAVLPRVTGGEAVGVEGIIPHHSQVPAQGTEHPVGDEPWLGRGIRGS
jgi:hypothetical protein